MSTFYINKSQIQGNSIIIEDDDVNHIKNVLRYEVGDTLKLCDNDGIRYDTKIINYENNKIFTEIINVNNETTEPKVNITLYQALPKSDKLEMIIQKTTELRYKRNYPYNYR